MPLHGWEVCGDWERHLLHCSFQILNCAQFNAEHFVLERYVHNNFILFKILWQSFN